MSRPKILYIISSSMSLRLLRGQLQYLQKQGFEVSLIISPGEELTKPELCQHINIIPVSMERGISPLKDLQSLAELISIILQIKPDLCNSGTTKAGLLGGLASWLTRVPSRFFVLRGIRLETTTGMKRWLLWLSDKMACACATQIICVSNSVKETAEKLNLLSSEKAIVIGKGSSNGIDPSRFATTSERKLAAQQLRKQFQLPEEASVIGFVGRFTRDKGIKELLESFLILSEKYPALYLLLVGDFDQTDPVPFKTQKTIQTHPRVIVPGFVDDVAAYYQLMDIVALPTYREGFPNVVLEAGAAKKPVVATKATGCVDAVVDGETGLLVDVGNVDSLTKALELYMNNRELREKHGAAGYQRVLNNFRQEIIWEGLNQEYSKDLQKKKQQS